MDGYTQGHVKRNTKTFYFVVITYLQVKILMEIMEKRIEALRSTIVCSQREPDSWKAMIMNDEVSANAIMKRATKHYIVVIQPIETP